jgi:cytochrome c oxidase cbb3-type subunit 3
MKTIISLILMIIFHQAAPVQAADAAAPAPVLEVTSAHNMQDTLRKLREAIIARNFRIIRDGELDAGMEAGLATGSQVVEFCNFAQLHQGLATDARLGAFLPCRVIVTERDGVVRLLAPNPLAVSVQFANPALAPLCGSIHDSYVDILDEVSL